MAPEPVLETYLTPIYYTTGVFGVIFILGLIVPRGPNAAIVRTCISLSAFCMWIFWLVVYVSQMNPVLGPVMHNTSIIWIARKWGLALSPTFRSREYGEPGNDLGFDVEPSVSRVIDKSKAVPIAPDDLNEPTSAIAELPDEDIQPSFRKAGIEPKIIPASDKTSEGSEQAVPKDEEPKIRTLRPDFELESSLVSDDKRKRRAYASPDTHDVTGKSKV